MILERGKYFSLELLVLHPKDATPTLTVIGKIAGIEAVRVRRTWLERDEASTWAQALVGRLRVQLARVLVYGGGTLIGLVALIVAAVFLEDRISSPRRKRQDKQLAAVFEELKLDEKLAEALAAAYRLGGVRGLGPYNVSDNDVLRAAVQFHAAARDRLQRQSGAARIRFSEDFRHPGRSAVDRSWPKARRKSLLLRIAKGTRRFYRAPDPTPRRRTSSTEESMIAAIYARKSTEQNVTDDAKSVTRQVELARDFARQEEPGA